MSFSAVLLDNDGVLVDTEPVFFEANCRMMREFGYELEEASFAEMSMTRGMSLADIIVSLGHSPETAEAARRKRNLYYDEMLRERAGTLVIPGVPEALAELHRHFRLGVVTCCQSMHFKTIHDASGLGKFFDFVVGDDDFTHYKPHPEPYLTALKKGGLAPGEAVAVEDSERGILSARAAGIATAAIPRGLSLHGDFSRADHRFPDLSAFAEFMLAQK